MTEITTQDLTEGSVEGAGIFDELMRSTKAHLEQEYSKQRIRGGDYANVYLGSLTAVMQYGIQFLLEKQRSGEQAELLKAQTITEQKQQALLEEQTAQMEAQTRLTDQQVLNAVKEGTRIDKQICKLEAEYDALMEQKLKTVAETALLGQKKATEAAQTIGAGVDADSYIGRQKMLYQQQAEGFLRDAEQKAAKLMVDSWNVRRTTDEGTVADGINKLSDTYIGRSIDKLLDGVQA